MDINNPGKVCMTDICPDIDLNHSDDDVVEGSDIRSSQMESHFGSFVDVIFSMDFEGGNCHAVADRLPIVNQQDDRIFDVASMVLHLQQDDSGKISLFDIDSVTCVIGSNDHGIH